MVGKDFANAKEKAALHRRDERLSVNVCLFMIVFWAAALAIVASIFFGEPIC